MHKSFSLVLGGGAVRGLAHIGVIERLEELGVAPVEISGTSIGAIIGAFYAAGYTSKEMKEIVQSLKFLTLIDLDFKNGLIKGNKLMKFFNKYLGDTTFSALKIPLSIVATDIDTGEKIVFRDGKVIDAIRASIGIPGVFTPYKHQGRHFVDGGIMDNLPIGVLDHQESVVAVSVQMDVKKKLRVKKSFFFPNGTMFSNSFEIIRKTINIMMIQNEKKSLELCPGSHLIQPGRDDIDYYDFKKMNVMITEGYRSSESLMPFFNS